MICKIKTISLLLISCVLLGCGAYKEEQATNGAAAITSTITSPSSTQAMTSTQTSTATLTSTPTRVFAANTTPSFMPIATPFATGRLLFVAYKDDCSSTFYTINADGTGLNNLGDGYFPRWSPDGKQIAFNSDRKDSYAQIFVMNADGSGLTQITQLPDEADKGAFGAYAPIWSPDGQRIAFERGTRIGRQDSTYTDIFVMRSDGTKLFNLTHLTGDNSWPSWSPDGKYIAYISWRSESANIYITGSGGTASWRLTQVSREDAEYGRYPTGYPAWSPDGKQIAFRMGDHIYVINADGSVLTQLFPTQNVYVDPAWSPDGRRIAFIDEGKLIVVNSDGSNSLTLYRYANYSVPPTWSPDGNWIAFETGYPGSYDIPRGIQIIRPDGSEEHVIVSDLDQRCGSPLGDTSWQP